MRNEIVSIAGKDINVQEKRIGELEKLIGDIFPESKGKISNIDQAFKNMDLEIDIIYEIVPKAFPELTKSDLKNAYMSELEALMGAFVNVNFFGIKNLLKQLTRFSPLG